MMEHILLVGINVYKTTKGTKVLVIIFLTGSSQNKPSLPPAFVILGMEAAKCSKMHHCFELRKAVSWNLFLK